jgi:hypothetical protein
LIVIEIMNRDLDSDPDGISEVFIERFAELGIHRIDELEQAAHRERDTIKRFTKYWLARTSNFPEPDDTDETDETDALIAAGIGMFYLIYVLIWRKKDRVFAIRYFESNSIGAEDELEWNVDKLMSFV